VLSKRQFVEPRHATDRDKGDLRNGRRPVSRSERHVTCVCNECDGHPAWAKISESAMEKQHACAAAINCSGLDPGSSSNRDFKVKRPRQLSPAVNVPTPAGCAPVSTGRIAAMKATVRNVTPQ
jgi:hypothetical protein